MTTTISISNQKGGVGKTTTAVNLATALAAIGRQVLLVDLDPQGNATTGLGVYKPVNTCYDLLMRFRESHEVLTQTRIPGLTLVPADTDLIGAEVELVQVQGRENILKDTLATCKDPFDYVIIDSPPSMGILSLNAFVAADGILAPMQCEYYALEGLSYLLASIGRVKKTFNPRLELMGIVLTMLDARNTLCLSVMNDVRTHFGGLVFESVIPRNVRISEAPSHGKPVLIYDVKSTGARAYMNLAKEFLAKEKEGIWRKN